MIKGLGIDIVEIQRIKRAIERNPRFLDRIYSSSEKKYFKEHQHSVSTIAGYFAAKEACSKALGTGFIDFGFKDIEIVKNKCNKPSIVLHGNAKILAESLDVENIHLSISHSKISAVAQVILE